MNFQILAGAQWRQVPFKDPSLPATPQYEHPALSTQVPYVKPDYCQARQLLVVP